MLFLERVLFSNYLLNNHTNCSSANSSLDSSEYAHKRQQLTDLHCAGIPSKSMTSAESREIILVYLHMLALCNAKITKFRLRHYKQFLQFDLNVK